MDDLHPSTYFQVLLSFYQSFGDCTKSTNFNWYNCHFHVPQFFFQFPSKVEVLIPLFAFFQLSSVVRRDSKVYKPASSLFLLIVVRSDRLAKIRWSVCMSKSQRTLCVSFSRTYAGLCIYHFFVWPNFSFCTIPSGSPCPPSRAKSYTLSVLICCIRLSFDWWFCLYHHTTYICCFVASHLFSLWYG